MPGIEGKIGEPGYEPDGGTDRDSNNSSGHGGRLTEKAGESPEYMLTGHVALAFWAEGSADKNKAIELYREALGSYMDDMIEYAFAVERLKRLRHSG